MSQGAVAPLDEEGNTMKLRSLAAVLLAAVFGLGGVAAAQAATPCYSGTACLWQHSGYGGTKYSVSANWGSYYNTVMLNAASSAAANGAGCKKTRFYEDVNAGEDVTRPWYFQLYSQQRLGYNYQDPDLKNGAGIGGWPSGPGGNGWNDTVEGWRFVECG
ncbi:peptidase inhibitor family I36 protein [Oerskovia turbata]|uniref:peptidase inhibitor family I36 protein n=1 Tax=Oerskovia turbata TaxID=1713 RepID=UPI0013E99DC0|nr:peptidase inhibitor family I36 protein [Oerskovia turbata]